MKTLKENHEYNGFSYRIVKSGGLVCAAPHAGQDSLAGTKDYIRSAVDTYLQETTR